MMERETNNDQNKKLWGHSMVMLLGFLVLLLHFEGRTSQHPTTLMILKGERFHGQLEPPLIYRIAGDDHPLPLQPRRYC